MIHLFLIAVLIIGYTIQIVCMIATADSGKITTKRDFWEWIIPFYHPTASFIRWFKSLE